MTWLRQTKPSCTWGILH